MIVFLLSLALLVLVSFALGVQVSVAYLESIGLDVGDNVRQALRQHPWLTDEDPAEPVVVWERGSWRIEQEGDDYTLIGPSHVDFPIVRGLDPLVIAYDAPYRVPPRVMRALERLVEDTCGASRGLWPTGEGWGQRAVAKGDVSPPPLADDIEFFDGFCTDVGVIKNLVKRLVDAEDALGVERSESVSAIQERIVGKALMGSARLDVLTQEQTTFRSFWGLVNAKGGFRPTLACQSLADAYDEAQEGRGDARRAERRAPAGEPSHWSDADAIHRVTADAIGATLTWTDKDVEDDEKQKELVEDYFGEAGLDDLTVRLYDGFLTHERGSEGSEGVQSRTESAQAPHEPVSTPSDDVPVGADHLWPTHTRAQFSEWVDVRERARVDSGSTTEQAGSTDEGVA